MTADAGNVRSDGDARVARYAERIADPNAFLPRLPDEHVNDWTARAVAAVADGELAELRAEVERLRAANDALRVLPSNIETMLGIDPNDPLEQMAEVAVRERRRAEAAEAALRAVEALRSARGRRCNVCTGHSPHWDGHDKNPPCEAGAWELLDAVLASHPTGTPEGGAQ